MGKLTKAPEIKINWGMQDLENQKEWKDKILKSFLAKLKELIKTLLLIVDNKASQMEFQLCVADAKQFLNNEAEK